jgi:hypothetical protein
VTRHLMMLIPDSSVFLFDCRGIGEATVNWR